MKNKQEDRETPIRPFEVDGIQECDNPLPRWWVGLFILTVIFAIIYMVNYHVIGQPDHLEHFLAAQEEREKKNAASQTDENTSDLEARLLDPEFIGEGEKIFANNCSPCHGANGEGGIGANLTDDAWIHGGSVANIIEVIEKGVLEKGMPAWKDILGRKKIEQATALIVSWRNKNLPGKAAEGEPYKPE